jgi:hypothetical protein
MDPTVGTFAGFIVEPIDVLTMDMEDILRTPMEDTLRTPMEDILRTPTEDIIVRPISGDGTNAIRRHWAGVRSRTLSAVACVSRASSSLSSTSRLQRRSALGLEVPAMLLARADGVFEQANPCASFVAMRESACHSSRK